MCPITTAVYLFCLALAREVPASNSRTVEDVLTEHGLPLVAAKEVRVEARRWTLGAGFWPTQTSRLVTVGLHPIDTKEQARQLAGEVLIYCSDPVKSRRRGDLLLWAQAVGSEMARATPFLGAERPGAKFLRDNPRVGAHPEAFSLPLTNPLQVTLVYLDHKGHVRKTARLNIIELADATLGK